MNFKIFLLHLINFIILLLSLGSLGCHIAQLVILSNYSDAGWWPSFVPYVFYYVGPIVSILSTVVVMLTTCFYSKSLWITRVLSLLNVLMTIAFIVYISISSGTIPWPETSTSTQKGFVSYCPSFSNDHRIYQRCWLVNGSWLGMVLYGFFWLIIALLSWLFLDVDTDDYDSYDYKQDVPMSDHYAAPELPQHAQSPTSQDSFYYSSRGTPFTGYEIDRHPYYDDEQRAGYRDSTQLYSQPRRHSKTYLDEDNQSSSSS